MQEDFLNECLLFLKREDIKENIKEITYPILQPLVRIL